MIKIVKMMVLFGSAIVWGVVVSNTPKSSFLLLLLVGMAFGLIWFLAYEFWKTE